jgi:hypothetical protein
MGFADSLDDRLKPRSKIGNAHYEQCQSYLTCSQKWIADERKSLSLEYTKAFRATWLSRQVLHCGKPLRKNQEMQQALQAKPDRLSP